MSWKDILTLQTVKSAAVRAQAELMRQQLRQANQELQKQLTKEKESNAR